MQKTYDALVKLALFCANQARTSMMKDAARETWRLAVEYQTKPQSSASRQILARSLRK
jgi:hypothetical protein